MNVKLRRLFRAIPFFILAAVLLAVLFYPKKNAQEEKPQIIEIWNVDTFEGGKGSRTAFLGKVARRLEEEQKGVWCLVTGYTEEGAMEALSEGKRPDILSFGVGLDGFAEYSLPLPYPSPVGNLAGHTLAVPWCMGGYYLFTMDGSKGEGKTAISVGKNNLSPVAAAIEGISGEEVDATAAYVGFLQGDYDFLLGTQRDVCRFAARGVSVESKPLTKYCDLFQCVSVLSREKRELCNRFVSLLLSPETEAMLSEIGMDPPDPRGEILNVFTSQGTREELLSHARAGDINFLGKFLKSI